MSYDWQIVSLVMFKVPHKPIVSWQIIVRNNTLQTKQIVQQNPTMFYELLQTFT